MTLRNNLKELLAKVPEDHQELEKFLENKINEALTASTCEDLTIPTADPEYIGQQKPNSQYFPSNTETAIMWFRATFTLIEHKAGGDIKTSQIWKAGFTHTEAGGLCVIWGAQDSELNF